MRPLKRALVLSAVSFLFTATHEARSFPTKPVRLIVSGAAGSPTDLRARQLSAKFREVTGQPLVVDNRPGGNQFIAAQAAARAPADGHTLLFGNVVSHAYNPWLFRAMPYRDQDDFTPVTMIAGGYLMMAVGSRVPATDVAQFLALARANPGRLNFAMAGDRASPAFLAMEQIKHATGIEVVGVAYKSMGAELSNLVTGDIAVGFNYWPVLMPFVKSGQLRVLAVASPRRLPVAPDIPTFAEAGLPGMESFAWNGIFAPAGTPHAVVAKLNEAFAAILRMPDVRSQIVESGAEVGGDSPEAFAAFVRAERARWGRIISAAGITPE